MSFIEKRLFSNIGLVGGAAGTSFARHNYDVDLGSGVFKGRGDEHEDEMNRLIPDWTGAL